MKMSWDEFNTQYKVCASIIGTAELKLGFNSGIYVEDLLKANAVYSAFVIDRKTGKVVKNYRFHQGEVDCRDPNNALQAFIVRDFQIDELKTSWRDWVVSDSEEKLPMPEEVGFAAERKDSLPLHSAKIG